MFNLRLITFYLFALFTSIILLSCSESSPTDDDHDHLEAEGLLLKQGNTIFMRIYQATIDNNFNQSINLKTGQVLTFSVIFLDGDGDELPEPTEPNKSLGWVIDDNTIVGVEHDINKKWSFSLKGLKEGETKLELRSNHNDHPDFKTPKIPVIVSK